MCLISRANHALGYIPKAWRHKPTNHDRKRWSKCTDTSFFFPGAVSSDQPHLSLLSFLCFPPFVLIPVSLMSFMLHKDLYAYMSDKSTDTALRVILKKSQYTLENQEIFLGTFLDIEKTFNNISINSILQAATLKGVDSTCRKWIHHVLENWIINTNLIIGEILTAKLTREWSQGEYLLFSVYSDHRSGQIQLNM